MNTVKSLIFAQDINKLNNSFLKEICEGLDLDTTGTSNELTSRILSDFDRLDGVLLEKVEENIFTGATSLAWYKAVNETGLSEFKSHLISQFSINPFENVIRDYSHVGSEPVIVGASEIPDKNAFYLRLIYREAVNVDYVISEVTRSSRYGLVTVFVDLNKNVLEIRASSKVAKKVNQYIASLVEEFGYQFQQYDFLSNYDNKLENIADVLDGQLIDAQAKPNRGILTIDDEKGEALVSILSAIDSYYDKGEISHLEQRLENEDVREILETTPFTVLLLSGLEKVGLGSIRELRGLPLYDYLDKYLNKEKGLILFNYVLNGTVEEYSVKIGMNTNTFKFNVGAQEEVVEHIRTIFVQ